MSPLANSRKIKIKRLRDLLLEENIRVVINQFDDDLGVEITRMEVEPTRVPHRGTLDLRVWGVMVSDPEPTISQDFKFEIVLEDAQGQPIAREKITIYQDSFAGFERFEVRFLDLTRDPVTVTASPL